MAAQVGVGPYRYYAGFSAEFVNDVLDLLQVTADDLLLDPWNGSGTSTLVAQRRDLPSVGIDINPVMIVVGRGRHISEEEHRDAVNQAARTLKQAPNRPTIAADDPLRAWFDPRSAARIREMVRRVAPASCHEERAVCDCLTVLEAHLLTAAFLTVRSLLKPAMTSNPTWVRERLATEDQVRVTWPQLRTAYLRVLDALEPQDITNPQTATPGPPSASVQPHQLKPRDAAEPAGRHINSEDTFPTLITADITETGAIDSVATQLVKRHHTGLATVVIGSPPYCTRIDYAVATRPELAVLGLKADAQKQLRRRMLGTTTVEKSEPSQMAWSATADQLLTDVTAHSSRASGTYYRKWLAQYLDGYWKSLTQLDKLSSSQATIALVVQDSFYKDQLIDLAAITVEYAEALGWAATERFDYRVPRTMASINSKIRVYRDTFESTESVLIFTKGV